MSGNASLDDKRVMPPIGRWMMLLKNFNEVPLPNGRVFSQNGGELMEKREGCWERSEISVNELLESVSDLSGEQWRGLIGDCSGSEEAEQWREKILKLQLPGSK